MDTRQLRRPKISAVTVCYRDAPTIPYMYERLVAVFTKLDVDYEIIYVNNGSEDNAPQILAELAATDPRLVVVNFARNFQLEGGYAAGLRVATGDAVVLLDGDLQDPPEMITDFYAKWREGYEVIYGVRVKRVATLFLQLAYKLFYRIFRATSYITMPVDAGDFSLLDRRVVNAMNSLPETNRFNRGLRAWVGFRQIGVPYVRPERMFGHTTNNLLKNLYWARRAIFSFSYAPLEVITWLGLGTTFLAFLGIIFNIIARLLIPDVAPSGIITIIVLILFMGGIQLLCLSIIGSYLSHIYDEVKRRPPYIIESILNAPNNLDVSVMPVVLKPSNAENLSASSTR